MKRQKYYDKLILNISSCIQFYYEIGVGTSLVILSIKNTYHLEKVGIKFLTMSHGEEIMHLD